MAYKCKQAAAKAQNEILCPLPQSSLPLRKKMNPDEWEKHQIAYHLYDKLIDFLVGHDPEIAILALQKCIINLRMAQVEDEEIK